MSKSRRSPGEGSVYRQREGMWAASITLPDGKRKYFYARTRQAVMEKLRIFRIRLERGDPINSDGRTVGQYLIWWIEDQKPRLARETWRGYESRVRLHLIPIVGHVPLNRLTPLHVRQLITDKLTDGYSSRQINNIYDVLHVALEHARKMEIVDRNAASLVDAPTISSDERTALTVEQANRLLAALDGHRMQPLFRTLLTLGLRPGEGLGLEWNSVDLERRKVRVETTLQRHDSQWVIKREPKNKASKNTLGLPNVLVETLRTHRDFQGQERETAGLMWQEWGLVFTRPSGEPIWYSDANRFLAKTCAEAKVPKVTMHELRHSTPSILLSLGVDQRVIMQVLRHSTIVLSANLYTHVVDPLVQSAMDKIDEALHGNRS